MPSYKLLSQGSPKIDKSNKIQDKYFSRILYLAPDNLADSKRTVCPYAKIAKCNEACLNSAGMGKFSNVQQSRIRKTLLFLNEYDTFMDYLFSDLTKFLSECDKLNKLPAIRLNGTSDIQWEYQKYKNKTMFDWFPSIQFYDYTKIPTRKVSHISNYHLTWSYSEANLKYKNLAQTVKDNIAVVFRKELPRTFLGLKVIDGDKHDMRFLDESNVVVGLTAKGPAKKDYSGFVVDNLIEARAVVWWY